MKVTDNVLQTLYKIKAVADAKSDNPELSLAYVRLLKILNTIPHNEKLILCRRYYLNETPAETARWFDIPAVRVKGYITSGLKHVKELSERGY